MTEEPGPPPSCVALVPARAGSKRVVGKNVRPLGGHPLLAYTIAAALQSRVFEAVVVSTESGEIARIECLPGEMERLMDPARRQRIDEALRAYGYRFVAVDLRGYRSGSLNPI